MKNLIIKIPWLLCPCFILMHRSMAQLTFTGQLRTRTEMRDGYGTPLSKTAKPGLFTSQRTRLSLNYTMYRLKFGATLQDVRVWGQDVSTINRTTATDNNGLMLHEAWAEIFFTDTTTRDKSLSLKLGRQELVYDDQRLIGNLDWLQQARRHDAAVLKYETRAFAFHLAAAFNQNKENASGTIYNSVPPGTYSAGTNGGSMYKGMQFFYAAKKMQKGTASFLFFSDQFSKYHNDSTNSSSVKTFENGSWARYTTGFYVNNSFDKLGVTLAAYYQFGKNATGENVSSKMAGAAAQYAFCKEFSAGPGVDYYSGGSKGKTSTVFDPLYGTPHKFGGLMDYFFASSPFGKQGLADYYLKLKYNTGNKISGTAELHQFNSVAKVINSTSNSNRNLGQEIDATAYYTLTRDIGFEAGYSHFFGTPVLTSATVKNVQNAKLNSNWAYLQINIKPQFNSHPHKGG